MVRRYSNRKMCDSLLKDIRTYSSEDFITSNYGGFNNLDIKYLLKDIIIRPSYLLEFVCCFPNKKMFESLINDVRMYLSKDFIDSIGKKEICSSTFGKYLLKYNKEDIDYVIIAESNIEGIRDALFSLLKDIRITIPIDKIHFYKREDDIFGNYY